jgi:hypothetical protein
LASCAEGSPPRKTTFIPLLCVRCSTASRATSSISASFVEDLSLNLSTPSQYQRQCVEVTKKWLDDASNPSLYHLSFLINTAISLSSGYGDCDKEVWSRHSRACDSIQKLTVTWARPLVSFFFSSEGGEEGYGMW